MAEESESTVTGGESLIEKISEKLHDHDSSSSSDSDSDSEKHDTSSVKEKVYRLFGREKPVHSVLGGGKPADVLLWRNKKISASVLGVATAVAHTFIHKTPPHIPEIHIPEEPILQVASALRIEINRGFAVLRNIASGRDLKKFLIAIAGLWILSVVGNWSNFLTLFYISFVLLHTVPVLYEKHEDKVDPFAERAANELKKHYAVLDAKVLSKIPKGPLKGTDVRDRFSTRELEPWQPASAPCSIFRSGIPNSH
ncbi:hypothetical protein L6164_021173 [Bauhinia variegata]|uniref:Uncharacterized protein n=1 Tax=Bauhinia variegata TaxID=167791 RepID=A0ACB9N2V0_BAUVA|nr:hypothetical protein L6164_021173 [Bauhinia variegata]